MRLPRTFGKLNMSFLKDGGGGGRQTLDVALPERTKPACLARERGNTSLGFTRWGLSLALVPSTVLQVEGVEIKVNNIP